MGTINDDLAESLAAGHTTFRLRGVTGDDASRTAVAVRRAVEAVRHPEEPDEQFANYLSAITDEEDGASFYADLKDIEAYPESIDEIVEGVTAVMNDAPASAHLTVE